MTNTLEKLSELVIKLKIDPVLVDIGCSGDRYEIWDAIAPVSTLIGFDPDKRELNAHLETGYKNNIIIDRVVCDDDNLEEVDFVFTSNPYCSSLLQPDLEELRNYVFYDYFVPVSNDKVQATSLNRVIKERKLPSLDWIKIDSQGMDLKIINSLDEQHLSKVVALDVEPGFIPAYKGEDLFPSVHEFLVSKGFWLADLRSQKYPRVNSSSLHEINCLLNITDENGIEPFLIPSPTAAEARYLRTISSAAQCGEEQLLFLFVFSILCGLYGFAFDVKIEHEKRYGKNLNNKYISDYILNILRKKSFMPLWKFKLVKNILKVFPSIKRYL